MVFRESFSRRMYPLAGTQFLGVFNDNAFKMLAILAVVGEKMDYVRDSTFLLLLTISYVLPFLIMSGPTGALADRISKRSIMLIAKIGEFVIMIAGAFCLANAGKLGMWPILATMFMMTMQSAFFSPAFNGILPETFSEQELSRANGNVGIATFVAAISGVGGASLLALAFSGNFFYCGLVLSAFSVLGLFVTMGVVPVPISEKCTPEENSPLQSIIRGYKALTNRRPILLSALGEAYFLGIGVAIQTLLVMFAKYTLNSSVAEMGILQLAPAIGMGLGCYLAGRLSGGKIELGLVPYGAAGMTIFLPLAAYLPGSPVVMFGNPEYTVHIPCVIFLMLGGICGGFFVIPLKAFVQQKVDPAARGAALAFSNVICFGSVMLTSIVVFLFAAGAEKAYRELPAHLTGIVQAVPSLQPQHLLAGIGILTVAVTACSIWILPDFALRFFIIILTHTLYKIRIFGAEKIPPRGPILFVSNHVSFIDGILLTACTSRMVRFLMHEDYYQIPGLNRLVRFAGFIEVPSHGRHKSMSQMFESVKAALRQGEAVCVFPEGKITRNGLMDEFKSGFAMMLPDDVDVKIIPVRIGMIWGSIFSYYYGKIKIRMPNEIPHPVTVTFGDPVPRGTTAFELREIISELAADTEMKPRDKERPLHYQIAKHAKRIPFRVIACDHNGNSLTAFQLCVRAALLSREIRRIIAPDCTYVGVMLPNSTASAASSLGVMMADKVPAMINFTSSKEAIETALRKAKITHILTSRMFISKIKMEPDPRMVFLEDVAKGIPGWKKFLMAAGLAILPHQEFMNIISPASHRDVFKTAVLLFSSGSTGIPKGVMLSHHNFNSDIYAFIRVMNWTKGDIVLGNLPLFHAFGLNTCFWLPLMIGCKVVYVTSPLDCDAVGCAAEKHKVTILLATPTFMQAYMRKCKPEQFQHLRLAIAGAEKLRTDISAKFSDISLGQRALIEGYGCTELSPIVSINVGSSILDLGKVAGKPGSIGSAMPGICVKIVDPVTREMLPPDTEGLMLVKGPIVMQGYLDEPKLTAEAIRNGWYNTGDIAKMDVDGYITICGRVSRFSKIAGEMVPHELVECTINEILGLDERVAAVCGIPDASKGEALVVLYTNLPMPPERIIEEMRSREITNLWIPKISNFHKVDRIPLLGSGKLDLPELKRMVDKIASERKSS